MERNIACKPQAEDQPSSGCGLRLVGTVAAGFPTPFEEELGDLVSLDTWLIANPSATYLVKVSGDSMIEAGIMPGDVVIVDRAINPVAGDIVIAVIDGNWTMKSLHYREGKAVLYPANQRFRPLKPQHELRIQGVVRSCVRHYR